MNKVSHAEMWLTGTGAYAVPNFVKDRMMLVDRLRNPAWEADNEGKPRRLNIERTVADMAEAAGEIKSLKDCLEKAVRQWKLYADMEEGRDLANEQSPEGSLFRLVSRG